MNIESFPRNSEGLEREHQWQQALKKLDYITDGLGLPIEESIKEAVAALNINGIPTSSSCGGHIEQDRLSFPYIGGEASGEPQYRYQGEDKIIKDLMEKHKLSNKHEIFDDGNIEDEYYNLIDNLDETEEYKEWYLENEPLTTQVSQLIEEFYITKSEIRIRLTPIHPGYRIEAHDRQKEFIDEEQKEKEIQLAQKEFQVFTEFLKNKFLIN